METKEMTSEVLNDLVQINNDRIVGYERAIKELKDEDADLKVLFAAMVGDSHQFKMELTAEISAAGEEIDTGTTNTGKIYRVWMDVKAAFTGYDRKAILASCEFGEDAAQKAYQMALDDQDLSFNIRFLISVQKQSLKNSHDKIKSLRDAEA